MRAVGTSTHLPPPGAFSLLLSENLMNTKFETADLRWTTYPADDGQVRGQRVFSLPLGAVGWERWELQSTPPGGRLRGGKNGCAGKNQSSCAITQVHRATLTSPVSMRLPNLATQFWEPHCQKNMPAAGPGDRAIVQEITTGLNDIFLKNKRSMCVLKASFKDPADIHHPVLGT